MKKKFEPENFSRISKIFAPEENDNKYKSQDGKMAVIEAKIKDVLATLTASSKLIPAGENTISQKIKNTINDFLNRIKQDTFLKLIDISGDPAALLNSQHELADPAGIIGIHNDKHLYQYRRGSALLQQMIQKPMLTQPQNVILQQQPNNNYNNLEFIKSLIEINFDGMQVPDITPENYNQVITQSMQNIDENIVTAYRDAVISMLNVMATTNTILNPDALIKEAQSEFCQNVRLLVIKAVIAEISNAIFTIGSYLQELPGGDGFNLAESPIDSTQAVVKSLSTIEGQDAREIKQYNVISTSIAQMSKISLYLERITEVFEKKLSGDLTEEGQQLALIFGVNPDSRPTTKPFGPSNIYPTILHEAAKNGDYKTAALAIKMGADPDSLVVPMPTWSQYYYGPLYFTKSIINWFVSVPTPTLEGKTPLLYASQELAKDKKEDTLKTVLTIYDSGGNLHKYNETGASPYGVLSRHLELSNPSDKALIGALRGTLNNLDNKGLGLEFSTASTSKFDDDKGGGAVAITTSEEKPQNNPHSKIEWINNIENEEVREYLLSLDSIKNMEKNIAEVEAILSGPRSIDLEIKKSLPESDNSFLSKGLFLGCIAIKTVLSSSNKNVDSAENDIGTCALIGAIPTIISSTLLSFEIS